MSHTAIFEHLTPISLRDAYARIVMAVGESQPDVMMLDADLSKSTKSSGFADKWPERHMNIGIAEQNMVGIAAGLATMNKIPLVNTFAAFLTRRACDQIAISVAYPKLNVKFFGFHGGINLGEDGATQQAVEDIAIMRAIPNIRVYSPIDANDLAWVTERSSRIKGQPMCGFRASLRQPCWHRNPALKMAPLHSASCAKAVTSRYSPPAH